MTSKLLSFKLLFNQIGNKTLVPQTCLTITRNNRIEALKRKQERLQLAANEPVHLKGGFGDRVLLGLAAAMVAMGVANGLYTIFRMAFRKGQ